MKITKLILSGVLAALSVSALAQTPPAGQTAPASQQQKPAPMPMTSLDQKAGDQKAGDQKQPDQKPPADPFPPVNPKFFTATTPTAETVNNFLKQIWGYDPNRIWRVEAVQTTSAPGVSKVIVFVSDRTPNAKVQTTAFFVTPDGNHALAGDAVISFGPTPFAESRKLLQAKADGAARGAASKDLMLVEFADLQCPHCKDSQATMDMLVKDFPNAKVVFQSFPLVDIHPFAFKAAAYGYCVQKQKSDAFFPYAAAVFDAQTALTAETGDATLKAAVTKAGLDPTAVDACAATQAVKDQINASVKLGEAVGVNQTPMISVNGQLLPLGGLPYETLKAIVSYRAVEDGVTGGAPAAATETRKIPTLGK